MLLEANKMNTVLFCIPLKENTLQQFKDFVKTTSAEKHKEWQEMLVRYDLKNVKIWNKSIEGKNYVFVYHEHGPLFEEKIKGWNDSPHEFDQWFNQQIMAVYDTGPTESAATSLLELKV